MLTDDPRLTHEVQLDPGESVQAGAVTTAEESQAALEFEA